MDRMEDLKQEISFRELVVASGTGSTFDTWEIIRLEHELWKEKVKRNGQLRASRTRAVDQRGA